jgi:GNAT superfamily N-acetyltransferase
VKYPQQEQSRLEVTLRSATPTDVPVLFELIQALAEYEKLSHAVVGNADALKEHLFSSQAYIEAILAEYAGQAVGFALFFHNYSTFLTKPGIYLEDLFVLPEFRRKGIGQEIFTYLAQLAVSRDCGHLEWSVLDWNEPAIAFYRRIGAVIRDDGRICRVSGDSLIQLADTVSTSTLRSVVPDDVPMLFRLIQQKAEFDKQSHALVGSAEALQEHLFGSQIKAEAIWAEQAEQAVGFALFFYNYSTFLTKPGLFIDDWFILPDYQHQGIDKAILTYLAQLAVSRGCGRVEWMVEVWNQQAIAFYESMGVSVLPDWRICQVSGDSLIQLAAGASSGNINQLMEK